MSSPIDPRLLLKVLEPILDLYGGVKSTQIANRFVNVMRDARKLVHRCVYLNILKATPTQDIRKQILTLGAWNILYDWLKDAERDKHWSVIKELLELYLELPVTIDLLKLNHTPKLIRQLSKRSDLDAELKHLAADIVLIWKDIIVGESSNDPQITNNNNNNSFSVEFDKISQVSRKTTMMKQIDPNIDIEESEDSSSNHTSSIHHSPIVPASYGLSKPMSTNIMNSPGNVFEKLKPTDSFSLAISSADKSLSDSNKRPKTTKSYPSKFRSGFDAEPEPPNKKPKPTIPTTPKVSVADVIKANAAKRHNEDGMAKLKTYADKKIKPAPPALLDSLLPPVDHVQTPSTSGPTVTSPVMTTSPAAISKPKQPQPKAVQLIESSSFMAALEGTAAQKASLIRKKKIVPKSTSTTNVATGSSTNAVTSAGQNKNDILIAKPQFYKEIVKPSQAESSPPLAAQANREGKKRVRWATDNELVQVQYFEIDETERINVNRIKAWGDLKHFEMHREREFMEAAKKHRYQETNTEEVYCPWRLIKFDGLSDLTEPGKESQEKTIQAERQKNILAEVYLPGMPLPDSPKEPDLMDRIAQHELVLIPLDETGTTTTQLPPELNKLLEGLKQNGMMPNSNMVGQGNVMNMPNNMIPNMMQQAMRPPPNMPPPMMNGPASMMPPNSFVSPQMPQMGPNASPNMMMYPPNPNMMPNQIPRNGGPPMYGVNMNMPPRNNWGPMNGPAPIRPPGPAPMNKPPFQNRPPFRGRPPGAPRPPYKNYNKSCPYFEQGRCTFGDQCRYMHIKRNDYAHQDSEGLSPDYSNSSPNETANAKSSPKADSDLRHPSSFSETLLTPMSPDCL